MNSIQPIQFGKIELAGPQKPKQSSNRQQSPSAGTPRNINKGQLGIELTRRDRGHRPSGSRTRHCD